MAKKLTDLTINDERTVAGNAEGTLLVGRYRIVKPLGQGGMGSVWLAEDTQLDDKPFAIKMLPAILVSNKRAYRQLKDEALVAMQLVHPNIVQIRAFEENDGNPFLVMDYVDGQTLDDYLAEKRSLPEAEVLRILNPIAAALDYAHGEGVVHRDVKPANVMIRKDGHPFILDFGIAREIQETLTRVTGKLSSGTLLYMSPEQLNGAQPKPPQDVYSFAAMAYECLKGEPPFARGQIEHQILNNPPAPLPGGPRSCAAAIMAGLAKEPENRPATCTAVLNGSGFSRVERVEGVNGRGRSPSGPQPGGPRLSRPSEPQPGRVCAPRPPQGVMWKVLSFAVVLGLVVAGGVTWWVLRKDAPRETARYKRSPKVEKTRNARNDDAVQDKSVAVMATTDQKGEKKHPPPSLQRERAMGQPVDHPSALNGPRQAEVAGMVAADAGKADKPVAPAEGRGNVAENEEKPEATPYLETHEEKGRRAYELYRRGEGRKILETFSDYDAEMVPEIAYLKGVVYRDGLSGVKRDLPKTAQMFTLAANRGHAQAQLDLAVMYAEGIGVSRDLGKFLYWTEKAAEQGVADAALNIGYMYFSGGAGGRIKVDYAKALKYLKIAADAGRFSACPYLGTMYQKGWGVNADNMEALKWFKLGAENGDALSENNLGYMYLKGFGTLKDTAKAMECFQKAVAHGNKGAAMSLGFMYENGDGVPQDLHEARRLYLRAKEHGVDGAEKALQRVDGKLKQGKYGRKKEGR